MLQNARVTAFAVFELLRENQLGGKITQPTKIRVKLLYSQKSSTLDVDWF